MAHMTQRSLKQIMILLMMAVRSAGIVTNSELVDRMVMADRVVPVLLPELRPMEQSSGGGYALKAKSPKHVNYLRELLNVQLFSCLTMNSRSRPAGIEATPVPVTGDIAMMRVNMSRIFRDMSLWKITNTEHQMGMYYFSGNADEEDFHRMLSLEDLDDAIGLVVIPGYKMVDKNHISSLWGLVQFLSLALDNVWSQKLHTDDHLALWDNIFRILIEVGSGEREYVELPNGHQSTCSCYRMIPHILKVCEWIKAHPKEEANMLDNPAQALRTILDKVGCADVCSTGHLCLQLFGLLPILGIKSLHIEKDVVSYDGTLDSVVHAKIERLSFEGAFAGVIESLLGTLTQTDDDDDVYCSWKHLRAPGWNVSPNVFIEIVTKLKQLESIEDVTVDVFHQYGNTLDVFNNPRARRLLSKCIVSWGSSRCNLSHDGGLREAIKDAKIEHLFLHEIVQVNLLLTHPEIWQNLKTVRWSNIFVSLPFEQVMTLVRIIPSLENIVCPNLIVMYDGTPMCTFSGKIPRKILSTRGLEIKVRDGLVVLESIPESFLELLWEMLTDRLSTLTIHGKAIESLPAPKLVPAFANKFTKLCIHDLGCLSTDMCSYLAEIGGGVENLNLYSIHYPDTLVRRENENLAALLGSGCMMTPLGMSATYVGFNNASFGSLNLELLLGCDKLATIGLYFSEPADRRADNDEAISRVAAAITKLGEKEKGPKVNLNLENHSAGEVAKLLRQICPSPNDPARVINRLEMLFVDTSIFTDDVMEELERYLSYEGMYLLERHLSVERMNPPTSDKYSTHSWEYSTDSE